MATVSSTLSPRHIVGRIAAGVLGGYVFVWGFVALGLAGFYSLGMPFHDAEHLASILGFLLYLIVFLWAFAAQNLNRVWFVLIASGVLMAAIAALLQHLMV